LIIKLRLTRRFDVGQVWIKEGFLHQFRILRVFQTLKSRLMAGFSLTDSVRF
jgi:hypothetical protein